MVAATTKLVGSHSNGGSWELDTQVGIHKTIAPLTAAGQRTYAGVMATFTGTGGDDTADATNGTLTGFTGGTVGELQDGIGDTFNPQGGADTIVAGDGDDTLNGFIGADSLDGGAGTDTLVLSSFTGSFSPTDLAAAADNKLTNIELINATAVSGTLNLANQTEGFIINGSPNNNALFITGSAGADTITTGNNADTINAGGGADTINGFAGADTVNGGVGNDTLTLANTSTTLNGAADSKLVDVENVTLTAGGVTLNLSNQIEGFTISGSTGTDTITAGGGNDLINNFVGADSVDGGAGSDTLVLTGSSFSDLNSAGDDKLTTVETINATNAGGILNLATQTEGFTITGGASALTLTGSTGEDTITTGSADDTITGGNGNDIINAGGGDDTATGGSGNDTIDGGLGTNTLILSGNRTDYSITLSGSTYTIVDTRSGAPEGTDSVTNIENFQFADATFTTATLDVTPPTISSVDYGTNDGTLKAGETVTFIITYSENVTVAGGTPTLTLDNGSTATLTSGFGTNALTFSYTVASGDDTSDLAVTAFALNGATIKDSQGNNANTTGAVTNPDGNLVVDTIPPDAGTLALAAFTDSGTSSSDFVSNDSTFDLSLTGNESGSTVAYEVSTDGGSTDCPG